MAKNVRGKENKKSAMEALEAAKRKFAKASERMQAKRQQLTKARRTIATGSKRIDTLEKKIEEAKDAPSKAVELLLKKAAEMEKKSAEIDAEQEGIIAEAAKIEKDVEAKTIELETAKEKSDAELEAMGVPKTTSMRTPATGTTAERRAKNNFQYRLKSKDWNLSYNTKGRIESASKFGLNVVFEDQEFIVTGGGISGEFKHPYGEGSLTALAQQVKEHGTEE